MLGEVVHAPGEASQNFGRATSAMLAKMGPCPRKSIEHRSTPLWWPRQRSFGLRLRIRDESIKTLDQMTVPVSFGIPASRFDVLQYHLGVVSLREQRGEEGHLGVEAWTALKDVRVGARPLLDRPKTVTSTQPGSDQWSVPLISVEGYRCPLGEHRPETLLCHREELRKNNLNSYI